MMVSNTNTTFSEEMAILADTEYGFGKLGNTGSLENEDDASTIVSVQSKGTGKAIHITGINRHKEGTQETGVKHHFPEEGDLGNSSMPNLLSVAKQDTIHKLIVSNNISSPKSLCYEIPGEKESFEAEKTPVPFSTIEDVKVIPPREAGACSSEHRLPLKKRGHAKQQSPYKCRPSHSQHEGVVKRNLQKLKNFAKSEDKEDNLTHLKEFKQLFESIVIDAVRRGTPIDINGRPHNILAVPVETEHPCAEGRITDTGITPRLDLYGGIIDRPPPSISATRSMSLMSEEVSEDEHFEDYRDVPGEIPFNQSTLLSQTGYPCAEHLQEYMGIERFYTQSSILLNDSVMDEKYPSPKCLEDEEVALDLSLKGKPSTPFNHENTWTTKEMPLPFVGPCQTETQEASQVLGADSNKKASMSVIYEREPHIPIVATNNYDKQNLLFNLSQLTPEIKKLLITLVQRQKASNLIKSTQTKLRNSCQAASVKDESLPDLNRLELTNENGSYKETENELIKRKLKAKINR